MGGDIACNSMTTHCRAVKGGGVSSVPPLFPLGVGRLIAGPVPADLPFSEGKFSPRQKATKICARVILINSLIALCFYLCCNIFKSI